MQLSSRTRTVVTLTGLMLAVITTPPAIAQPLDSGITRGQVESRSYLSYTLENLDNLLTYGTDRYGSVQSDDLLVSILDVRTKENVYPGTDDEPWHTERRERRAPGGTNFLSNQTVLRAMYHASDAAGDAQYAAFADRYMQYSMTNHVASTGTFWWGWHRHYDVHTDQMLSEPGSPHHEIHANITPLWDRMYALNPAAVTTEIEQMWQRHVVDKSTGEINRHDDGNHGLAFLMSSGAILESFAFMYEKTAHPAWLDRATLLADYNWNHRNPDTDLVADAPNTGRWDGQRAVTTLPGLYVPALNRAAQYTGDADLAQQAQTYLLQWARAAWDENSQSFFGSLQLDGTPVPGPRIADGSYGQYEPRGLVDLWQPDPLSYEHPPETALAFASFYAQTGDPELLMWAERWDNLIRQNLPATHVRNDGWYRGYAEDWAQHGTYAEHYGLALEFFLTMYEATGTEHYLFSARDVAKEAITTLWYDGLFRGHANKPYFEAVDGVGYLLDSLVTLDGYEDEFGVFGDFDGNGIADLADRQILLGNWLQDTDPYAGGDVTGDGFVNELDLDRFDTEYLVPEPAGIVLMLLGTAAILARGFHLPRRSASQPRRHLRHGEAAP